MHQLNRRRTGGLAGLLALPVAVLLAVVPNLFVSTEARAARTVTYEWFSFFDIPMPEDVWDSRVIGTVTTFISRTPPIQFTHNTLTGDGITSVVAPLRLKVTARELPEINIDKIGGELNPAFPTGPVAGFVPHNLMGGLEAGVAGGTMTINGTLQYGPRPRERDYKLQFVWGFYGWESFWDATMVLDRNAAKKVLGVTEAEYNDIGNWWAANRTDVERTWRDWIYREGSRLDMAANFYNFEVALWTNDLTLSYDAATDKITMTQIIFNEALEVTYARWFKETFLLHFQGLRPSFTDMTLNMTIGPSTTDVDLDAAMDIGFRQLADGAWAWESWNGDKPFWAGEFNATGSYAFQYFGKIDSDYAPTAWDLQAGETLKFNWASTGLTLRFMEPDPADFPDNITVDPAGSVIITGPIDMRTWSETHKPAEHDALGGLLPQGVPYLELEGAI